MGKIIKVNVMDYLVQGIMFKLELRILTLLKDVMIEQMNQHQHIIVRAMVLVETLLMIAQVIQLTH